MRSVGVLEAKTNLSGLLDELASGGDAVIITRHGKPIARITAEPAQPRMSGTALAARLKAFRDGQAPDPEFDNQSWEQLKRVARDEDDHG